MGGMGWEMGGRFKREGTCIYLWLIHVDIWQKPIQYCKGIILQVKINKLKKKKSGLLLSFPWRKRRREDLPSLGAEPMFPGLADSLPLSHQGSLCYPCGFSLVINLYIVVYIYGEGNGTPFQYSCLENAMDGGAW